MKRYLLIAALTAFGLSSARAELMSYYDCDFSEGLPSGISLVDKDGQTLHYTMTQRGFASCDSWISLREEGTENLFAASASRFKAGEGETPKPASDWMVLPKIWIRGGEASLAWKSRIVNEQSSRPSRYEVRVSEKGNAPDDFTDEPLATVEETTEGWTVHSVDLSSYAGRRVWIAFVNVTDNGEILGIDDISVEGTPGIALLSLSPGEYAFDVEEGLKIGGSLTASGETAVSSFSAVCTVRGESYNLSYSGLNLKPGDSLDFQFPLSLQVSYGEKVDYEVNATVNDIVFDPVSQTTTCLAFLPERRVVIEEATGTWCQYCPMGTLALQIIEEKYPDNFIPIAVHLMPGLDPMALDAYGTQENFASGAPSGWIDRLVYSTKPMVPTRIDDQRTYTTLMGGFETLFLDRMAQTPLADISLSAEVTANEEVEVSTQSRFPLDIEGVDYRLCIVLTEDHVTGRPEEGYRQMNGYSGMSEIIGGYENLPRTITEDLEFNHVARAIYDDYHGIPQTLPTSLKAGETYSWSGSFAVPKSVLAHENLNVVAMILDNTSGEILNAASVRPGLSGVDCVSLPAPAVCMGKDFVKAMAADSNQPIHIELTDISGQAIRQADGIGETTLSTAGVHGVHILRIRTNAGSYSRKLLL